MTEGNCQLLARVLIPELRINEFYGLQPSCYATAFPTVLQKYNMMHWYLSVLLLNALFLDGIVISHLPDGPTAHFKLSSVKLGKDIKVL